MFRCIFQWMNILSSQIYLTTFSSFCMNYPFILKTKNAIFFHVYVLVFTFFPSVASFCTINIYELKCKQVHIKSEFT